MGGANIYDLIIPTEFVFYLPDSLRTIQVELPEGFSRDNFYIVGSNVKYSDNNIRTNLWEWIDMYVSGSHLTVTLSKNEGLNKKVTLFLMKNPYHIDWS